MPRQLETNVSNYFGGWSRHNFGRRDAIQNTQVLNMYYCIIVLYKYGRIWWNDDDIKIIIICNIAHYTICTHNIVIHKHVFCRTNKTHYTHTQRTNISTCNIVLHIFESNCMVIGSKVVIDTKTIENIKSNMRNVHFNDKSPK